SWRTTTGLNMRILMFGNLKH
ncbi:hypothetical protein A5844_001721, partial [Enterococcus sp. 10A9_DIV0425]